jgi:hypothetical protein
MQINKIRDEKGNMTINTNDHQRIMREYFEILYSNKVKHLEEMNKFLLTFYLPKLKQEDMITEIDSNEIDAVIALNLTNTNTPQPFL